MLSLGPGGLSRRDESMVPKVSFHLVSTCARSPFTQSSPTRPPVDTTQISPFRGYGSDVSKSLEARFQPSGVSRDPSAMNFSYRLITSSVGVLCDLGTWAAHTITPKRTIKAAGRLRSTAARRFENRRSVSAMSAQDRPVSRSVPRYFRGQWHDGGYKQTGPHAAYYLCALTHRPTTN